MPGALTFGANASDRVALTNTGLTNLNPITVLLWVNVTTLANSKQFLNCSDAGNGYLRFALDGASGDVSFLRKRATTSSLYITNSTPLSSAGTWRCIAVTYDSGATPTTHIYAGATPSAIAEATYGTATDGSGAVSNDATGSWIWGNRFATDAALLGKIAFGAIFNAAFSLADIKSWAQIPRLTVGANVAKAFGRCGKYGNDWIEYGGPTPTVTGATQTNGPPIGGMWTQQGLLYQRAA